MISPSSPSDIRNVCCSLKQRRFSKITNDTNSSKTSLRKQPTFRDATTEKRTQEFHTDDASLSDLGSASDWLKQIFHAARPIRSINKIWLLTRYQYAIPAPVSRASFSGKPVVQSQNVSCFL